MLPRTSGKTFSVREAASFLGVRTEEIYRLLKEGKLKGHRMSQAGFGRGGGAVWVIPEAAVMEWANSSKRRKKDA